MLVKKGFTLIELILVIVIIGIIGSFGSQYLAQAYNNFIYSKINNELQEENNYATEFISNRLQYRIKDSIIARKADGNYTSLSDANSEDYNAIEWIQKDITSFRGISSPYWSGIIDIDNPRHSITTLVSPETNTTAIDKNVIYPLSYKTKQFDDGAIYFIGSNNDIDGYGWNGNAILDQTAVLHPIKHGIHIDELVARGGDFSGIDIYENYIFTWSANALVLEEDTLYFYYNYQPWNGDSYTDGDKALLSHNVKTFRAMAIGSLIKIQLCIATDLIQDEEYALCKEKTIF